MNCWRCREYASEEAKQAMESYMRLARKKAAEAGKKAAETKKRQRRQRSAK